MDQKKEMYITSLLNETLPLSLLTGELLDEFEITKDQDFGLVHLQLSNEMQARIEAQAPETVADWKTAIHDVFIRLFQAPFVQSAMILNLAPYTRTLVYSYPSGKTHLLKTHISNWFSQANQYLHDTENAGMMAFANPQPMPFEKIGLLYKDLRRLQAFHFIIGMDHLAFYDAFTFNRNQSTEIYQFSQRFNALLGEGRYQDLLAFNKSFSDYCKEHCLRDAEVIYICKELMSAFIHYLYSQKKDRFRLIDDLNYRINNFTSSFNDLDQAVSYMDLIINDLFQTDTHAHRHPHIRKVLKAVDLRYSDDLTLDGLADSLGISSAYLSRLFKEAMGISFKLYLTHYRLNIIKDLLRSSNQSISEIAPACGYRNASQMTRIFKKYEQMTPREYRRAI